MQWHRHMGEEQDISVRLYSTIPSEGVPPKTDPLPRYCPFKIPSASVSHWVASSQHESLMDTLKPHPRHISCSQQGSQSALGVELFLSTLSPLHIFIFVFLDSSSSIQQNLTQPGKFTAFPRHPQHSVNLCIASKWVVSVRIVRILSSSKIQQDQLRRTPMILLGSQYHLASLCFW